MRNQMNKNKIQKGNWNIDRDITYSNWTFLIFNTKPINITPQVDYTDDD